MQPSRWRCAGPAEPWERWHDFTVRYVLTDLWEFEILDEQRREIALLLPADQVAVALVPEEG